MGPDLKRFESILAFHARLVKNKIKKENQTDMP